MAEDFENLWNNQFTKPLGSIKNGAKPMMKSHLINWILIQYISRDMFESLLIEVLECEFKNILASLCFCDYFIIDMEFDSMNSERVLNSSANSKILWPHCTMGHSWKTSSHLSDFLIPPSPMFFPSSVGTFHGNFDP